MFDFKAPRLLIAEAEDLFPGIAEVGQYDVVPRRSQYF